MAVNLIELAKSYLTDSVVEKMASANDTPPEAAHKALGGILPALAGSILRKVTGDGNANWLMDIIKGGNFGTDTLSNLGAMVTGSAAADRTEAMGESLTRSLFGTQNDDVARNVASFAGVRKDAASGLMEMAAPVLMGVIGQQVSQQNLGAAGLMTLITSQADHIKAALPSGLASLGGMLGVGALAGKAATSPVAVPAAGIREAAYTAPVVEKAAGGLPGWLLPLLGVVAAVVLLWYLMRGCENKSTKVSSTADSTTTTMGAMADSAGHSVADGASAVGAMADSVGSSMATGASAMADSVKAAASAAGAAVANAGASLGAFGKRKLPDGVELNVPANGIENKLIAFIEDKNKAVDKTTWFTFDRLEFATGKNTLLPKSQEQLANIGAILKAYPNVNLKLGGYTDNTGSVSSNMKLSAARAKVTLGELTKLGVAKGRLEAEGYGPEHPVASNNTPEGRQRNRRIDVRVTKK